MEINNTLMIELFMDLIKGFQENHRADIIDSDLQVIGKNGKVYENITDRYVDLQGSSIECIAKAVLYCGGFEMSIVFSTLIIRKPILKLLLRKKYTDYMKYQKMKSRKTDKYFLSVME